MTTKFMETSTTLSCSNFTRVLNTNLSKRSQSLFFHGSLGQLAKQSNIQVGLSSPYLQDSSLQYLNIYSNLSSRIRSKMAFTIFCNNGHGGFPFWPPESSWITWIVGVIAMLSAVAQRLLTLTKEVDLAAETVEKIADTVEEVSEDVDKMAEDFGEKLPEGKLKNVVELVEKAAEETEKDAKFTEDLMDKVEEIDEKLESLLNKSPKQE